jgi:hypothetical protein
MIKLLVLQSLYNLSDPELERQVAGCDIEFQSCLAGNFKTPGFLIAVDIEQILISSKFH